MKFVRMAAIATLTLLSGCGTTLFGGGVQLDAGKVLTVSHLAHKGLAVESKVAADNGWLTGTNASTVQNYLDQSEAILVDADKGYAAGQSISSQITSATSLMTQATALVPSQAKQ